MECPFEACNVGMMCPHAAQMSLTSDLPGMQSAFNDDGHRTGFENRMGRPKCRKKEGCVNWSGRRAV